MKTIRIIITSFLAISLVFPFATIHSQAEETVYASEDNCIVPEEENNNIDLLNQYILQQFNAQLPQKESNSTLSSPAKGAKILDATQKLCNALIPKIREVANGTRTSTSFSFTPKDIGIDASATANSVKAAEKTALGKLLPDFNNLLSSLLFQCPYELYWFDKTSNGGLHYNYQYTYTQNGSSYSLTITTITFSFAVSPDYRASRSNAFTVNTATGSTVKKAVSNAASIVNKYKGKSDFEKITGFKNEILSYAGYNHTAAGKETYYGNAWQLIWVFDGDSSTNVVCEGYAKAFQYLCDLAGFDNIQAICVTGVMSGGTGEGPHMWNVVHMPDNKNYLVDLTNSDSGTIGSDGSLFFKGYSTRNGNRYGFPAGNGWINYEYDSESLDYYTASELVLSSTDYQSSTQPAACVKQGFCEYNGKKYWYENWTRQGVYGDPKNIWDTAFDKLERGREIYDSVSDGWYWLDARYEGAAAFGKEVWMPYIYQNEDNCSNDIKWAVAQESDEGMETLVYNSMINKSGKWVRYDNNGKMIKGWITIAGDLAKAYPNQKGNTYYYDTRTGLMAKGNVTIKGIKYYFDPITGVLQN